MFTEFATEALRPIRGCLAVLAFSGAAVAAGGSAAHPEGGFADLVEEASPAVVNISVVGDADGSVSIYGFRNMPPGSIREYIEEFLRREGESSEDYVPEPFEGKGTGFVVDPAGYIVTNDHVVGDATEVRVTTLEGDSFVAEIVGTDSRSDIALIKIDTGYDLPVVAFGDSDQARVGDWVIAIGNQFGFNSTVSVGVISARNRNINAGPYDSYIQTDAAINLGSSGGPLLNLDGEVIGVNTAIVAPSGGSAGLGFAVPSVIARDVIRQLRETGFVRRGWLGVRFLPLDAESLAELGLDGDEGVQVSSVQSGSPADRAGIRADDVILRFDGMPVSSASEFPRMVAETEVGETVEVEVWRESLLVLDVTLGLLRDSPESGASEPGRLEHDGEVDAEDSTMVLGMALETLDDRLRREYGVRWADDGVVVVGVADGSAADAAGVRPGSVVVSVGPMLVADVDDVVRQVGEAMASGRETVVMEFSRDGETSHVAIQMLR